MKRCAECRPQEKYDEIVKRLEQAGAGSPVRRLYQVCFGDSDDLGVSDIRESREAFEKFGETLKPIMIHAPDGLDPLYI